MSDTKKWVLTVGVVNFGILLTTGILHKSGIYLTTNALALVAIISAAILYCIYRLLNGKRNIIPTVANTAGKAGSMLPFVSCGYAFLAIKNDSGWEAVAGGVTILAAIGLFLLAEKAKLGTGYEDGR